ncbi:MAG: fumarylacetoacetate hydrolase family protein [Burkholderiales bacterium]|nr:fumarylacetoacetate hydrolase family protein [Burkholderiales bacterium]
MLAEHRLSLKPLDTLPPELRPTDEAQAYRVQDALHALLSTRGLGRVSGHKIGCTTPVMQAFLNIPNPCGGGVFETTVHASPASIAHAGFVRVGVECEIVVELGRALPPQPAPYTREMLADAVVACRAGMEIVDARYVDYSRLDTPTLIADDFFDAGCVLGPRIADWRGLDLAALTGITWINGEEVGRGRGSDVMGHPLEALAWLANQRSRRGLGIEAGDFVFTGSVVATKWLEPGDHVVMEVEGLGRIEATFTAGA